MASCQGNSNENSWLNLECVQKSDVSNGFFIFLKASSTMFCDKKTPSRVDTVADGYAVTSVVNLVAIRV